MNVKIPASINARPLCLITISARIGKLQITIGYLANAPSASARELITSQRRCSRMRNFVAAQKETEIPAIERTS